MNIIILLITLLVTSNLWIKLLEKFNISPILSLLIYGLGISTKYFKKEINFHKNTIDSFGNLGIIFLMFIVGIETSWEKIKKNKKDTFIIAIFCFVIPFIMGFMLFYVLGYDLKYCFICGLVMAVTAEAINGKLLLELDVLDTDIGSSIIGIGLIDDILGIIIFACLILFFGGLNKDFILSVILFIAFFVGVCMKKITKKFNFDNIKYIFNKLLIPFFFISMGLHFNIGSTINNIPTVLLLIIIAIFSKVGGALSAKKMVDYNYKQLNIIGWGINSRGAIGLSILLLALRNNLISHELYSCLIIMILVTTIIFLVSAKGLIEQNKQIMNIDNNSKNNNVIKI